MSEFLIKSAISMAVLLLVYKLFLEREKMHRFNRFYLLFSLFFSLAIPFINIPIYVEAVPIINSKSVVKIREATEIADIIMSPQTHYSKAPNANFKPQTNYLPYAIWGIYALVTLILTVRFALNIAQFYKRKRQNEKVPYNGATIILLEEDILPHTFLNNIFLNKEEYKSQSIEPELYNHELTHVKQRHTLDILFIELRKTVFWFNPLLYFYKKVIQLNHEFLADEKVIEAKNVAYYQQLLLNKASLKATPISLSSNLNFSITKKRFNMMNKTTPKWKSAVLQISVAPILTSILLLLCFKTIAQDKSTQKVNSIKVETVTNEELESLQKAEPAKYNNVPREEVLKTTMTSIDKNNKSKDTIFFDKKTPLVKPKLTAISKIDPNKLKRIEILQLTEDEKKALREIDSEKYNDSTFTQYVAIKATFINEDGEIEALTSYEKKPDNKI
ncbi:M56 family metallopeptidase [Flavobacterium beibuense]|uniref:Peptidase M56 BlaR1 n=1 Tax=Flavobacterium beibuense TaxID=657326 RepID=A0A444WBW1_9FLAO|nr:M56 family metallopeptidase [Flavobacterium beibuense]RYJ43296.1 Peptidase M56 BlaR1 [Flavobacterium beibuense]